MGNETADKIIQDMKDLRLGKKKISDNTPRTFDWIEKDGVLECVWRPMTLEEQVKLLKERLDFHIEIYLTEHPRG